MPTHLKLPLVAVAVAGLLLTGCGTSPQSAGDRSPSPTGPASPAASPSDSRQPVAKAGGLCKLLNYRLVADTIEVDFDHAAAGKRACALQVYGHEHPDLTLAATGTEVSRKDFMAAFAPDGADQVSGLGKAAYSAVGSGKSKAGPTAEVGWLAGKRVYVLRYTFESGASKGQARQLATGLVKLAKRLKTG